MSEGKQNLGSHGIIDDLPEVGRVISAKADQRSTDRLLAPFIFNSATELRAPIIRFEEAAEYAHLENAARKGH